MFLKMPCTLSTPKWQTLRSLDQFVCRSQAWVQWNSFRGVASQQEAKMARPAWAESFGMWHVSSFEVWVRSITSMDVMPRF